MDIIKEATVWVSKKLAGPYEYKENHYQNTLSYALQKRGCVVSAEENLTYTIQDGEHHVVIGYGRMDLKIITPDSKVFILELKVAETLKYLKSYSGQLRRYLRHYPHAAVGVLIVFNSTPVPNILQLGTKV